MPATSVTPEAIQWKSGYVVAPDAFYHRAKVDFDRVTGVVQIKDQAGNLKATYTLADHTHDEADGKIRGTLTDGGDVWINPDSGCACQGYKRTAR